MGGGKLHVLLGSLPRSGAHALAARDGNAGPKTAMAVMQPQGKDYDSLADRAAESQVIIGACWACVVRLVQTMMVEQLCMVERLQVRWMYVTEDFCAETSTVISSQHSRG